VVDSLVIKVLGRNNLLDDLLLDFLAELFGGDVWAVLSTDDDSVDTLGHNSTTVVLVFDSDLGLGIRSEPWERAIVSGLLHGKVEPVGELDGQWKQFRGFVGGISKHDTLITGTELLESLLVVQTLGNIWRLLFNGNQNVAGLVVETLLGVIVSNVLDGVANDLLVVESGFGGDFAKDHDHTSLGRSLTSDFGQRVVLEACVEDGITDLVGDLVGMTLTDRLGGEEESARLVGHLVGGGGG